MINLDFKTNIELKTENWHRGWWVKMIHRQADWSEQKRAVYWRMWAGLNKCWKQSTKKTENYNYFKPKLWTLGKTELGNTGKEEQQVVENNVEAMCTCKGNKRKWRQLGRLKQMNWITEDKTKGSKLKAKLKEHNGGNTEGGIKFKSNLELRTKHTHYMNQEPNGIFKLYLNKSKVQKLRNAG